MEMWSESTLPALVPAPRLGSVAILAEPFCAPPRSRPAHLGAFCPFRHLLTGVAPRPFWRPVPRFCGVLHRPCGQSPIRGLFLGPPGHASVFVNRVRPSPRL